MPSFLLLTASRLRCVAGRYRPLVKRVRLIVVSRRVGRAGQGGRLASDELVRRTGARRSMGRPTPWPLC